MSFFGAIGKKSCESNGTTQTVFYISLKCLYLKEFRSHMKTTLALLDF